jgi:hypothetical protein
LDKNGKKIYLSLLDFYSKETERKAKQHYRSDNFYKYRKDMDVIKSKIAKFGIYFVIIFLAFAFSGALEQ